MSQGYLSRDIERTVRVRVAGECAWLTVKGETVGIRRAEYEYGIPVADGVELLGMCLPAVIDKVRHRVEFMGRVWEVDVFAGVNEGLVMAELELADEGVEVDLPPWVGLEVSGDPRYYNANLAQRPFREFGGG